MTIALLVLLSQVTPAPLPSNAIGKVEGKGAQLSTDTGTNPGAQKLSFAQQAFSLAHSLYRNGKGSAEDAAVWSHRIYEAQKDSDPTAGKQHLERMVALEKLVKDRARQGDGAPLDVMTVSYYRAWAEQLTGKK